MRLQNCAAAFGVVMLSVGVVQAAPTMDVTHLPVSDQLRQNLKTRWLNDKQVEEFFVTLANIGFYHDHQNPVDEKRNDLNIQKVFWAAPFFTPSVARGVVGADQFADYALEVLDSADQLMGTFNFESR